jgi:hypothetical protein
VNEADVFNGAIHKNINMSDMFITLAAESELGALFLNAKGQDFEQT